jgi:hypothetical protein
VTNLNSVQIAVCAVLLTLRYTYRMHIASPLELLPIVEAMAVTPEIITNSSTGSPQMIAQVQAIHLGSASAGPVNRAVSSPEPEVQRGRKRRRDPAPFILVAAAAQTPSGGSSTFRGRGRHRSTSLLPTSSRPVSRRHTTVRGLQATSSWSPISKQLVRFVRVDRRRSQSPSRSNTALGSDLPPRRRRRTKSRSRGHQDRSTTAKSPARLEVLVGVEKSKEKSV